MLKLTVPQYTAWAGLILAITLYTYHMKTVTRVTKMREFGKVYNLASELNTNYECIIMQFKPPTHICLYPDEKDTFISRSIRHSGYYEKDMVRLFQSWIEQDSTMGVIDIGTNIGLYSLLAANMGHKVLSVEPKEENILHFHKAVLLNKLQNKIVLLQNAIGNTRDVGEIQPSARNQGATSVKVINYNNITTAAEEIIFVTMDDLVAYCKFDKAVIKIDVEGFEHLAFLNATHLFEHIYITNILMEWWWIARKPKTDEPVVKHMIKFLRNQGLEPMQIGVNVRLNTKKWRTWPTNMRWSRH